MKISNVFYFKNIVDEIYPDENRPPVEIASVVSKVKDSLYSLTDSDFCEIMISCFIPDLYSGMGKKEKLFTKLTELMVGEWWRRMGGTYNLPTKKSGTEDVELLYQNISIVCDVKVFRLGRSQKAPNVKDFLKLASVRLWIDNLNNHYAKSGSHTHVIGGLITYSSLHEWESDSEVYEECTNPDTPVVMFPYEILALLLKYKKCYNLSDLFNIWNYRSNHIITSREKRNYHNYITSHICSLLKINIVRYKYELKQYHHDILMASKEYRKLVQSNINEVESHVISDLRQYSSYDTLVKYAANQLVLRDNSTAFDYLKHIDDFRSYDDQDN